MNQASAKKGESEKTALAGEIRMMRDLAVEVGEWANVGEADRYDGEHLCSIWMLDVANARGKCDLQM